MTKELKAIDVDDAPELVRVAEEVRQTREPRLLRLHGEGVAVLRPIRRPARRRSSRETDDEAFRSAAGSWKDIDTDKLIADIYESRDLSVGRTIEV